MEAAGVPTVPGSEGRIGDYGLSPVGLAQRDRLSGHDQGSSWRRRPWHSGICRMTWNEFQRFAPQASAPRRCRPSVTAGSTLKRLSRRPATLRSRSWATAKRVVHCFERECSLQRRRQKVWEEAPARHLAGQTCARPSAPRRCPWPSPRGLPWRGHGMEFLYDEVTAGTYYFIEMNTRIQVEHPVTELVTGIDLLREMIRHRRRPAAEACAKRTLGFPATPSNAASTPRIRRRTSCPFRAWSKALTRARRSRGAVRFVALSGLRHSALLRFAARQADRLGRDRASGPAPLWNGRWRA